MKKVRINRKAFSDSSKNSIGHEFLGDYYQDIHYKCIKCKKSAVFSAQEQKEAFEIRKVYMWTKRVLCPLCWSEMREIKKELGIKEKCYLQNKVSALQNQGFLEEWLELLESYPKFGGKADSARIHMIKNALESILQQ